MAFVARDMIRNTPFALRAQQVIVNNTVGDGIIPKLRGPDAEDRGFDVATQGLSFVEKHLDTTVIDADGRQNLYGLQRLAMNTIVDAGEVLIVREMRPRANAGAFNLRLRVLEPDYLDEVMDGRLPDGGYIRDGIEYGADGARRAYHLFDQHPGGDWFKGVGWRGGSTRVPAERVRHVYRQDRPGQMRGVTWFAAVALALQDLSDYQDAQIMRQKIAACFAAFHRRSSQVGHDATNDEENNLGGTLSPGMIYDIKQDEDVLFGNPPDVGGFDVFMRQVLLSVASGLGITYEALVGDLSNVNFSSARMGRMEMERNISNWQWLMLIPQMMDPIAEWVLQEWALMEPQHAGTIRRSRVQWVPPHRILVDPAREIPALAAKVRAGFASRQGVVRELGFDPERLLAEQKADAETARDAGLVFDSDAAVVSQSGVKQPDPLPEDGPASTQQEDT